MKRYIVGAAVLMGGLVTSATAGVAADETRPLSSVTNTVLNLIGGSNYSVVVPWSTSGSSNWQLWYSLVALPTTTTHQVVGKSAFGAKSGTGTATITADASGDYTFWFTTAANNKVTLGSATITGTFGGATASVPGPIAGAGLPLLIGLAGYSWMRRRKPA